MPVRIEVGARYATASGLPVRLLEITVDGLLLQSLVSDNRLLLPKHYPLFPAMRGSGFLEVRASPYSRCPDRAEKPPSLAAQRALAPLIDAMLLVGDKTMRGMVRELRRKASAACKGKDLRANIRARLYWFKRKGYRIVSSQSGPKAVPPGHPASQ